VKQSTINLQVKRAEPVSIPQLVTAIITFIATCFLPILQIRGLEGFNSYSSSFGIKISAALSAGALAISTNQWYLVLLLAAAVLIAFAFEPLKKYSLFTGIAYIVFVILFTLSGNSLVYGSLYNYTGYQILEPAWGFYAELILGAVYIVLFFMNKKPKHVTIVPPYRQAQPWNKK
jgi:hypothetical protein